MFMLIKVPRGSIEEELAVVCTNLESQPSPIYIPRLFLKLALEIIRSAEKNLNLDCGPTAGSDAAFIARSLVSKEKRAIAGWTDMRTALYTTVYKSAREQTDSFTMDILDAQMPDMSAFLQRELADIDLALLIKNCFTSTAAPVEISTAAIKKIITGDRRQPELEKFSARIMRDETIANFRVFEVLAEYLKAYRTGIAELKKARGRIQ